MNRIVESREGQLRETTEVQRTLLYGLGNRSFLVSCTATYVWGNGNNYIWKSSPVSLIIICYWRIKIKTKLNYCASDKQLCLYLIPCEWKCTWKQKNRIHDSLNVMFIVSMSTLSTLSSRAYNLVIKWKLLGFYQSWQFNIKLLSWYLHW